MTPYSHLVCQIKTYDLRMGEMLKYGLLPAIQVESSNKEAGSSF